MVARMGFDTFSLVDERDVIGRLAWIPVISVAVAVITAAEFRSTDIFEPRWFLPVVNLIFVMVLPFATAAFAVAAYRATGVI